MPMNIPKDDSSNFNFRIGGRSLTPAPGTYAQNKT